MNIIDLLANIPRELDYTFSLGELYLIAGLLLLFEVLVLIFIVSTYLKLKKHDLFSIVGSSLLRAMIGLFILPIGVILDFLFRILTGNTQAIFVGNSNIFYAIGGFIFLIFYSLYTLNVVNLSVTAQKVTKTVMVIVLVLSLSVIVTMLIHLINPLNNTLVSLLFAVMALILLLVLILALAFLVIDFLRISNRLAKVRLGMTTIAGILFIIQWCFAATYLVLTFVGISGPFITIVTLFSYIEGLPAVLALYWGFFIPRKLQEWTGILPPSFKRLIEKKRMIVQMKRAS